MEMKKKNEVGGKWELVELFNLVEELPCNYGDEPDVHEFLGNVVKVSNVDAEGILYKEFEKRSFKKRDFEKLVCQKNDLLVVKSSGSKTNILSGKTAIVKDEKDLIASNFLMRLRVNLEIANPKYLWYYLNSKHSKNFIISIVGATTYPNLKWDLYSKMQVPLPPLATQQRIAAILDAADALRRKDQELLRKYDELAQAIFIDMFGDPVKNEKGWEVKKLGEVVHPNRIITYGIVQAGPNIPDGIPYIKTGDIKNGKILTDGLQRTSLEIAKAYSRSQLYIDDIVMSIRATVGTVALLPDELVGANLTQGTARISPSDCVRRMFLFFYLKSEFVQNWISINSKGATFREITLAKLRELPVQLPNISIQIKFEKAISKLVEAKDAAMFSSQDSSSLFHSLLQQAFNGELV